MATSEQIAQVRMEVADNDPVFPFLNDAEIAYQLDKNAGNVRRASLDCARVIMMKLSMRTDDTVDILSIKSSKTAENYRLALRMYLKSPDLNPVYNLANIYAGGISKSDMQTNNDTLDNNAVRVPTDVQEKPRQTPFDI